MKRWIAFFSLAALLTVAMTCASSADDQILYGTPTVDGEVDDLYLQSLEIPLDTVGEGCTITRGTTYILWDNDYIYFCAVSYENPTGESAIGFFFRDDTYQSIAVSSSGDIIACTEGSDCTFDINTSKCAAKTYDGYYVVELAVSFQSVTQGKTIGYHTCYFDNYSQYTYSYGGHFFNNNFTLSTKSASQANTTAAGSFPADSDTVLENSDQTGGTSNESTASSNAPDSVTSGTEENAGGCSSVLGGESVVLLIAVALVTAGLSVYRAVKHAE